MDDKIDKTKKKQKSEEKRGNPEWRKGMESPNPEGRPLGQKNYLTLLEEALEKEAKKAGITYWERLAQWCFVNPKLASAVLKKFIADKTHVEIEGELNQRVDLSGLSIEELKAIAYGYTIKNKSSTDKGDTKAGKD